MLYPKTLAVQKNRLALLRCGPTAHNAQTRKYKSARARAGTRVFLCGHSVTYCVASLGPNLSQGLLHSDADPAPARLNLAEHLEQSQVADVACVAVDK